MTNQNQIPNQNPPPPASPTPTPPPNSGMSTWMIVLLVLGVLVACVVSLYLLFGKSATPPLVLVAAQPPIQAIATIVPPIAETPPPIVEVPAPDPNGVVATALEVIYFRTGPGTEYPAYGLAQAGAKGQVIGQSKDGQWYVVQTSRTDLVPNGYGWVSADYVSISNPNDLEIPVIPAP